MPRRSTFTQTAQVERRQMVATLYLSRRPQTEIARTLGVVQSTVSEDLAAIRREWVKEAVRDFGERQAEELARIDRIEAEAWEGWERSKRDAETLTTDTIPMPEPDGKRGKGRPMLAVKETRKREGRDGSVAFLAAVQWCVEQRCKILGLYKQGDAGESADRLRVELAAVIAAVEAQERGVRPTPRLVEATGP